MQPISLSRRIVRQPLLHLLGTGVGERRSVGEDEGGNRLVAAVQRGDEIGRVRLPLGVLNHFTAGAGIEVVRGDRLPRDLIGDVLVGEPVGRLVRRAKDIRRDSSLSHWRETAPPQPLLRRRPGEMFSGPLLLAA